MPVIRHLFHSWERRLAAIDTNRIVRPFEWGLEWLEPDPARDAIADPLSRILAFARDAGANSDRFFEAPTQRTFERRGEELRFASALTSSIASNDVVVGRVFDGRPRGAAHPKRAIVVLPQWNSVRTGTSVSASCLRGSVSRPCGSACRITTCAGRLIWCGPSTS